MRQKVILISFGFVLLLFGSCERKPNDPEPNDPPALISLSAIPDATGFGQVTKITASAEDPQNDKLNFYWKADSGTLSEENPLLKAAATPTLRTDSVFWTAPNTVGTYRVDLTVSDGTDSIQTHIEIPVLGLFYDNFSDSLDLWSVSYADAWVESGAAHIIGNTQGYAGSISRLLNPGVSPEYSFEASIGYEGTADTSDYYGIFIRTNDGGFPSVTSYLLALYPSKTINWALWAFLLDDVDSGWFLLENGSKGTSPLIQSGENTWNSVTMTVSADSRICIKIGGSVLYETDAVDDLSAAMGRTISMDVLYFGVRSNLDFESLCDNALFTTTENQNSVRQIQLFHDARMLRSQPEGRPLPVPGISLNSRLRIH